MIDGAAEISKLAICFVGDAQLAPQQAAGALPTDTGESGRSEW